jgi:hypothetical protein
MTIPAKHGSLVGMLVFEFSNDTGFWADKPPSAAGGLVANGGQNGYARVS